MTEGKLLFIYNLLPTSPNGSIAVLLSPKIYAYILPYPAAQLTLFEFTQG